jgi:beta-lactamase regulating signal transducer with metallopeptidase domain/soluble cytochrome b562
MDIMLLFVLGSIKGLLLLTTAACIALALRKRAARVRAVIWSMALTGCLVIPLAAPLLPSWSLPMPDAIARLTTPNEPTVSIEVHVSRSEIGSTTANAYIPEVSVVEPARSLPEIDWAAALITLWAVGAILALIRLSLGLWRMAGAVRRARPVLGPYWEAMLADARTRVGCRRRVRLLASAEVDIPATVGLLRPAIVLPLHSDGWVWDRRKAVLLHELVHITRLDWSARMVARFARAIYWFNPLVWWATRRLDLEQELACDEEVLALGTHASSYACHLLGIARHALPCPAPAIPALGMARRTHLEERIMSILDRSNHRRVGLAVLIPAIVLMAAMVPALAAVYPGDSPPRPARTELKKILQEMEEAEAKIEPQLAEIEAIEVDMEPYLEGLEDIEISIDETRMREIEKQMEPYLAKIEAIEIDMEPFQAQMEEFEKEMENIELHIEDGTLEEVQKQIQDQIEAHMQVIESIHVDMEPFLAQIEEIQNEMEGLYGQMAEIHVHMEPIHEQMEKIHIEMAPLNEHIEELHRAMEPFHEEMERLGERFDHALQVEVLSYLRDELGAVTAPGADYEEAAARIVDDARIRVDDGLVRLDASRSEVREILTDLFAPHRIGTQGAFDAAIDRAATGLSPMTIKAD